MQTNEKQPLVTIGIPTFNRADGFLRQALESAVNQTYLNLEIIVSDNCSTDHTEAIVKGFNDPRIIYIKHANNIGANNNFNYCLNQAKGIYFALLSDDDLIDPDFIETCLDALNGDYEVGVIFTGTRVINENNQLIQEAPNLCSGLSTKDFFTDWFDGKYSFYLCSTLFHTEKLQKEGGFKSKTNVFQDVVADAVLAWKYGRIDVPDVKASFRRHPDNRGGKPETVEAWCEDCLYLLDILCRYTNHDKSFRKKGVRYFARKNFKLAATIQSVPKRLKTYHIINRKYNYSYTIVHYLYQLKIKPSERKFKKAIKFALNYPLIFKRNN